MPQRGLRWGGLGREVERHAHAGGAEQESAQTQGADAAAVVGGGVRPGVHLSRAVSGALSLPTAVLNDGACVFVYGCGMLFETLLRAL